MFILLDSNEEEQKYQAKIGQNKKRILAIYLHFIYRCLQTFKHMQNVAYFVYY